jgi:DNA-binding MarR family transcriptional regulator
MPSQDSRTDFGILLGLAYQSFVGELHEELLAHGFDRKDIAPTHGYVLRAVAEAPMNQRELSKLLGITDQGTAKICAEMERLRLLERVADPEDGRARMLAVGKRGRELLAAARKFHAKFEQKLARELGASVAATRRVLEALVERSSAESGDRRRLRPM